MDTDLRRWKYSLGLLSLDLIRPYLRDLWFTIPVDGELTAGMRSALADLAADDSTKGQGAAAVPAFVEFVERKYGGNERRRSPRLGVGNCG